MATKVLLVEDNTKVRELCERALRAEGYIVHATATAAGARQQQDFEPELLITDFGLPDETGLELATSLQAQFQTMLVLIISGHPLEMFHEDELPLTHGYLEKPFTPKELVAAVRKLLNRQTTSAQDSLRVERVDRAEGEWKRITGTYHDWE